MMPKIVKLPTTKERSHTHTPRSRPGPVGKDNFICPVWPCKLTPLTQQKTQGPCSLPWEILKTYQTNIWIAVRVFYLHSTGKRTGHPKFAWCVLTLGVCSGAPVGGNGREGVISHLSTGVHVFVYFSNQPLNETRDNAVRGSAKATPQSLTGNKV